ncbi:NAD(P)H-hydrate dehydratase [Ruegeria marina]|uniref:Bifunctional NAD(P)H-hydrate repair enzyme n=1 Tax=Ruegeria marina TaxID=639004 RepID=A0A1G6QG12_9RHOB|nr:NAD(P)H-hydrate dehydratase [Ruegeria marina]SDC91432.1 yjeF C-terminal region, hydroxyethylthiazole kinase-related/yjeF N-terminal region [Ruegeria marina]
MTELLTAAQMRAIEQAAIESGEVTGLELMERAGRGVIEAIFEEWPELGEAGGPAPQTPRSISGEMKSAVVLCGPGNNGGDGFVVARMLHKRGWAVEVFLYGDSGKLPPDARVNCERWAEMGEVRSLGDLAERLAGVQTCCSDLFVDAMFGTGLSRPVPDDARSVFSMLYSTEYSARVVAIDVPSGLCADSGRILLGDPRDAWDPLVTGWICVPELTVSFHRPKLGMHIGEGHRVAGRLRICDIGLGSGRQLADPQVFGLVGRPWSIFGGLAAKWSQGNKYTHGHALILSGGAGRTGAARLAARGALRIGAGLVTLGVPPSGQMEVACQITALMLARVEGGEGLSAVLEDARLNALCLGPGLGVERARDLVPVALAARRATVLDADALTVYAEDPEELFALLHENCVLTPHGGEFARLFPDIAAKLKAPASRGPAYSKVDATREAARRAGCVVLFKGPDTVIAAPDGRCSVNSAHYERSAPWLATAGSGDVLAGFITGLLARGWKPMQAAGIAAWLHVECALEFGPGLIAEDLPEQLPAVFRRPGD